MREADLTGAQLQDAVLQNVDFSGASLHAANLRRADLRGSDVSAIDPSESKITGAIIDVQQALTFAATLGLIVRDDVPRG
jgi:fluoroquinolone resistance protein